MKNIIFDENRPFWSMYMLAYYLVKIEILHTALGNLLERRHVPKKDLGNSIQGKLYEQL